MTSDNHHHPTVSILSAVYNESDYIEECIRSVQSQTLADFEHIIVDDQSTDDTFSKAQLLADARTTVVQNPTKGKVAAFNEAFRLSKGDYIVLLAGDDNLPENSLHIRVKNMEGIDPATEKAAGRGHLRSFSETPRFDKLVLPKHKLGNFTGGVVILTRALGCDVFSAPNELPNEDSWLRLCAEHFAQEIRDSPGIVLNYRIHERNSSGGRLEFSKSSENYRKRAEVYRLFAERYREQLTPEGAARLAAQVDLEQRRRSGSILRVLTAPGNPFLNRLSAAVHASPVLYRLRMIFFRFISGWR